MKFIEQDPWRDAEREHALASEARPLVEVEWWRVVFLVYEMEAASLARQLPNSLSLLTWNHRAFVSVAAVTMRNFRRAPQGPLWPVVLGMLREQRLLNLRTYVRVGEETGVYFMWGWLSRPVPLPVPVRRLDLTCSFAKLEFDHAWEGQGGCLNGRAVAGKQEYRYSARLPSDGMFKRPARESLAWFATERATGFFIRKHAAATFRAAHPYWECAELEVREVDDRLIRTRFPWFGEGRLVGAYAAPGFETVRLSALERGADSASPRSAFLSLP